MKSIPFLVVLFTLFISTQTQSQITTFSYTGGLQTYIVPAGVTSISIAVQGAEGGAGGTGIMTPGIAGKGACMKGSFTVTPGEVLTVLVGEEGESADHVGGGGGGSFVWDAGDVLFIAAGGGGGGGKRVAGDLSNIDGIDGTTALNGTDGNGIPDGGGVGGNGGTVPTAIDWAAGGAGWNSNGANGTLHGCTINSMGGINPLAGGAGGTGGGNPTASADGGYGGGGGGNARCGAIGGGGGGGYSGGGAGAEAIWTNFSGGGGGGSYNNGIDQVNSSGCNSGNGQVVITVLCNEMTVVVSDTEICDGEEVTLDATSPSGAIVTWDMGVTDAVAFTPAGVGVITYTATSADPEDCELTVDIEVFAVPTVTIAVDDDEICDGESVIFTGGGDADTYVWDPVDVIDGVSYTPAGLGLATYTLTGSFDATGCETAVTIDVTVHPLPTVTATVDFTEICIGEEVVFTGGGATTYVWDMGVTDGVPFTPAGLGTVTYTVIGTDAATGCENTASVDVTVNEVPVVTATADDSEVCDGEMVTLTGGGALTYTWDLGVIDGTAFSPPIGITTYTVTGTTASDCEATATIDITVHELPTITATADETDICEGDEITLTGGGADTYVWDLGVTDGVAFTPVGIGTITYTVIGTDAATDCENTATIDITIAASPIVTASADPIEICLGESVTFTGGGADTYVWDLGVTDGVAFTPIAVGTATYTVTGTDAASTCENTATVDVTVHEIPDVTATATTIEVCLGESVTLSGTGADSYTWDGGIFDGVSFTPTDISEITYTVTGTSAFGCIATASITISVIDCEPVVPDFTIPTPICVGDCITITDISTGAVDSWDWDFGGAAEPSTSTEQNPVICVTASGIFTVQLTTTSSTGAVSSVSHPLTVFDNPTITAKFDTIIEIGQRVNLIASTTSSGSFSWIPENDVDCPNCPITTANPIEDVTYTVTLIDENGCTASDTLMVLINFVEGVGVPSAFSPNGDGNNDILFVKGFALESVHLIVYSRYGEVVFETSDQNIGWDGTHKNKDENPGVFTWVLHYNYLNGKTGKQTGNTTLIR